MTRNRQVSLRDRGQVLLPVGQQVRELVSTGDKSGSTQSPTQQCKHLLHAHRQLVPESMQAGGACLSSMLLEPDARLQYAVLAPEAVRRESMSASATSVHKSVPSLLYVQ